MRERRYYILDSKGEIRFTADLFLFRTEYKCHPERLQKWMTGEFACAGWFTRRELRKQVAYLRRSFRERPDNVLERKLMAGFTLTAGKYRRPRTEKGYMWSDDADIWRY